MSLPHTPSSQTAHAVTVRRVNYRDAQDCTALRAMLNMYAQDPMGGATPLAPQALERLCQDLAQRSFAFSFLAWRSGQAVGLVNCFEGYSTFKAQPLVNIHDLAVDPSVRAIGVGHALLQAVQAEAIQRGACKITLEVLTGNTVAQKAYERFGFTGYQLVQDAGHAVFMQKLL